MNLVKTLYKIAIKEIKFNKLKNEKYLISRLKKQILLNKHLERDNKNKSIDGLIFQIRNINNCKQ